MSASPVDILVSSRMAPTIPGGLAQYQRALFEEIHSRTRLSALLCAASAADLPPVANAPEVDLLSINEPRRAWMSMASRPMLHGLLERWIAAAYAPHLPRLAERRPKAVHYVGTGWDFFGFAMHELARRCGVRFSVWPAVHPGQWGDDVIDLRLYKLADTVFCQSRLEAGHLWNLGLPQTKTVVTGLPPMCLPNGDAVSFRRKHELAEKVCVLFLGRRDPAKGYDALVEAWPKVVEAIPEAVLLLGGPGETGKLDLPTGSFRNLGILDEQEKADALAACDVFCLPSLHESFGIVYSEAWSYAKPVVCGPAPAPREWVEDGITGLWSDGLPQGIAKALITLLADGQLRQKLGTAGQVLQRTRLSWESILPLHLERFGLGDGASPTNTSH